MRVGADTVRCTRPSAWSDVPTPSPWSTRPAGSCAAVLGGVATTCRIGSLRGASHTQFRRGDRTRIHPLTFLRSLHVSGDSRCTHRTESKEPSDERHRPSRPPHPFRRGPAGRRRPRRALGLTACGNDSSPAGSPASTPAAATAPSAAAAGPIAAKTVENCLNATGLYISEVKEKGEARFGADTEIQLSVGSASDSVGVFVYPDASAASAGKSQIEEAGGSGVEVVNNSVFSGSGGLTDGQAQTDLAKVRSCATTGA